MLSERALARALARFTARLSARLAGASHSSYKAEMPDTISRPLSLKLNGRNVGQ